MSLTIDDLLPLIYHEKQESGSMLCAQHALNSLLQGSYDDDNNGTSTNMDDTGFFSVQVLENALDVWGLSLVRWRSEAMRPYQDHPQGQLAFVLNQSQHWYTLRRFGRADNSGDGHWFNLDSLLTQPEWVGRLYLSMVLHQAETKGYSVFAVVQADPGGPLALPRTSADEIACSVPENTTAPRVAGSSTQIHDYDVEGVEDEDYELQAALQASLGGSHTAQPRAEHDPVALSMQRNQRMLEEMRRQQASAQRELLESTGGPSQHSDDDDDEVLRHILAESEAMARAPVASAHDALEDLQMSSSSNADDQDAALQAALLAAGTNRVYDDDDEHLQAALRASLEEMPAGWTPPAELPCSAAPPPMPASQPSAADALISPSGHADTDDDDLASEPAPSSPPTQAIDMDEIRRRRLAKFGGS
ncbi:Josephin-domain-containing protein [Fistulina hepatica ATCC 64428]|uniref:ubiquitinyl hydrolase 1 n=1 Tax=Fistulina hepatica ATCC 64428 TaxID=1128425 RepID=A0A0D7AQZ8_9AGAR|nr:Josephin-domain-containing protein [Fistulina hepatica ATCC 64428]